MPPGKLLVKSSGKAKPPALVAQSLARIEQQIGGRDALVAALVHAPKSRDLTYLLGFIGDPLNASTSLADLCAAGGITAGELIEAYKSGEINRAQALATARVGAKLEAITEDTLRMALPREQTCPLCEGLGVTTANPSKADPNPDPQVCSGCEGTGHVDTDGDLEHKKLALELGKLLQKGGGVNVAVNQQVGISVGSAGGALEKLQAATDQILYGDLPTATPVPPALIEGEVIEGDAEVESDWRDEAPPV